ncbi:autotransporter domain-containing protein, partial [Fusobacterium varium]|uniref:beta strand repeat-containing protein n=1 Tax=Fusobacterium varium TaxID=856 RepID=UPI0030595733
VAFGAGETDVTVTGGEAGTIKITGVKETTISDSNGKLTVGDISLAAEEEGSLAGLLTVSVEDKAATIKGIYEEGSGLGTLTISSSENQGVTFLTTDKNYTSITSDLKVEVTGQDGKSATAMEAANSGDKVTNAGTIAVKNYAVGMVAGAGATAVNDTNSEITVGGEDSSVGMSAVTEDTKSTTLTNNGKITVTKGTGISVAGAGEAEVAAGEIEVADAGDNIGINIADGTKKTTVTGANITLAGAGTGINAGGNVTLKDIAITLSEAATGTGIKYDGGEKEAKAEISTGNIDIKAAGKGIEATMSKAAKSTLNITTGIISTGNASATGIAIIGKEATDPSGETPTTATVTTTLGKTEGTGVEVTGKTNNIINVTLQDLSTKESSNTVVSGTGVKVTGAENGEVTVKINQQNLKVTGTGNLVNIGDVAGTTNVDINQNVELADSGNIVKAGAITSGTLNINLNVGDKNTTSESLNVTEGNTALNLANVGDGTTFVKNTGNVTIAGNGTLLAGSDSNAISLSNQGLIKVNVIDTATSTNSSHISSGKAVNVANYGTIKLEISSKDFLDKYNKDKGEKKVTDLKDLTITQVRETLVALGIIASDSNEKFSSVGYIKFEGGELFTTAKALSGNQTVEGLSSALNQEDSDRAFAIAEGVE